MGDFFFDSNKFTTDHDLIQDEKRLSRKVSKDCGQAKGRLSSSSKDISYRYTSTIKRRKAAVSATDHIFGHLIPPVSSNLKLNSKETSKSSSLKSFACESKKDAKDVKRFVSKKDKMNDMLEDFFGDVTCKDIGNSSVNEGNKQPPSPKRSPTLGIPEQIKPKAKDENIGGRHLESAEQKQTKFLLRDFDKNDSSDDSDDEEESIDSNFIWPKINLNSSKVVVSKANHIPLFIDKDPPKHHPTTNPVILPASANTLLREYQREGVRWLYSRYKKNVGGVLGDEMGLGKTVQVICFIAAVLGKTHTLRDEKRWKKRLKLAQKCENMKKIPKFEKFNMLQPILVVLPASLLDQWKSEFNIWGSFDVKIGRTKSLIVQYLEMAKFGFIEILLMSYEQVRSHIEGIQHIRWSLIIFDEAHRLKSKDSNLSKQILKLNKVKCKIALTGTPMQNDMEELWFFFNIICEDALGPEKEFYSFYRRPILLGRRSNATRMQLGLAKKRQEMLHRRINTMMLQRKKDIIAHQLPIKEEKVVFCRMSHLQQRVYKRFLDSVDFQALLRMHEPCDCDNSCGSRGECCYRTVPNPLELFREYCDQNGIEDVEHAWGLLLPEEREPYERNGGIIYPYYHPFWKNPNKIECKYCPTCIMLPCTSILTKIACHLELLKPQKKSPPQEQEFYRKIAKLAFRGEEDLVGGIDPLSNFMDLADIEHCGKMRTLNKLIPMWRRDQHKLLIFSNYTRVLDILGSYLTTKGASFLRLDGSTNSSLRLGMCNRFNSDPSIFCFLISTKAGGVGLNLTGASRVVIFDPDWNPANDSQAQDRAFRIGQKQDVRVYRLISSGSIEEMKYIRQLYKTQVNNTVLDSAIEMRYFDGVAKDRELKGEIFGVNNLWKLEPDGHMKNFLSRTSKQQKKIGAKRSRVAADLSQYEDSASSRNGDYEISDDYVSKAILKASRNSENAPQAKQIRGGNMSKSTESHAMDGVSPSRCSTKSSVESNKIGIVENQGLDMAYLSTDILGANEREKKRVRMAREDLEKGLLKPDMEKRYDLKCPGMNFDGRKTDLSTQKHKKIFDEKMNVEENFVPENAFKRSNDLNQGAVQNIENYEKKQSKKVLKSRKRGRRHKSTPKKGGQKEQSRNNLTFNTKAATLKQKSDTGGTETPIDNVELISSVADLSKQFGGNVVKMADYIRKKYGVR